MSEIAEADAIAPCPKCGSVDIDLVPMPTESPHYAKQVCTHCGTFRGWEPSPRSKEKQQRQQRVISQLLKTSLLSPWEREFLESAQGKRSFSPRQREVLSQIQARVGGQG